MSLAALERVRVAAVVEDDTQLRAAIAGALRDEGFEVLEAPTLGRARFCLQQRKVGVVVLDLTLADGDGEPLLEEINAMPIAPAVVVLSADMVRATRLATMYSVPHLAKPFDLGVAATAIEVALERRMRPRRRTPRAHR